MRARLVLTGCFDVDYRHCSRSAFGFVFRRHVHGANVGESVKRKLQRALRDFSPALDRHNDDGGSKAFRSSDVSELQVSVLGDLV